jgi:hypothetical protein
MAFQTHTNIFTTMVGKDYTILRDFILPYFFYFQANYYITQCVIPKTISVYVLAPARAPKYHNRARKSKSFRTDR